ncbi:unnamed protein product [Polarella glacialis]|uniref:MsrB domain-containing protein n=1 Tax=Polarella glacialis TaxID=89957 RepID=A0A813G660_POLGL|nr:unnamed protein product [Polarella glacialis]
MARTVGCVLVARASHRDRARGAHTTLSGSARPTKSDLQSQLEKTLALKPLVMFGAASGCASSAAVVSALDRAGIGCALIDLEGLPPEISADLQGLLQTLTGNDGPPWVFLGGHAAGSANDVLSLIESGELLARLARTQDWQAKAFMRKERTFEVVRTEKEWRSLLPKPAYDVLRGRTTEPSGSSKYTKEAPKSGHFACRGCHFPLYPALSKFISASGWPSFSYCYHSSKHGCNVGARRDRQPASELDEVHGVAASFEVFCARCGGHLGHVFFDTFSDENANGERHCVNGMALLYHADDPAEELRIEKLDILPPSFLDALSPELQ